MRHIPFLLFLMLFTACAKPLREAPPVGVTTPGDRNPIVAALTHFSSLPDLPRPGASASATTLLVDEQYETSKGFIEAGQLASDVADEKWTIPEDARRDMERRTDAGEKLDTSGFPQFIRVGAPDEQSKSFFSDFSKQHPDVRASIKLWPPGFSRDGKRVLVRFLFGPSPHGASAVYLLEQKEGQWHVVHHSISYYV